MMTVLVLVHLEWNGAESKVGVMLLCNCFFLFWTGGGQACRTQHLASSPSRSLSKFQFQAMVSPAMLKGMNTEALKCYCKPC